MLFKRPEGYHEIETIFYRLPLRDRLTLFLGSGGGIHITCDHPGVPRGMTNTVSKAYEALCNRLGERPGMEVVIDKRVPVGGGFGGGSANAAAFLLAANELLGLDLSTDALLRIGEEVGADVGFFILNKRAAVGRGRGDLLWPIKPNLRGFILLVIPPFGISTAWAYSSLAFPLTPPCTDINMLAHLVEDGVVERLASRAFNHLEGPVLRHYPSLREVKGVLLERGATMAMMSGSGAALFGIFNERRRAEEAAYWMAKGGWKGILLSLGNGV